MKFQKRLILSFAFDLLMSFSTFLHCVFQTQSTKDCLVFPVGSTPVLHSRVQSLDHFSTFVIFQVTTRSRWHRRHFISPFGASDLKIPQRFQYFLTLEVSKLSQMIQRRILRVFFLIFHCVYKDSLWQYLQVSVSTRHRHERRERWSLIQAGKESTQPGKQ